MGGVLKAIVIDSLALLYSMPLSTGSFFAFQLRNKKHVYIVTKEVSFLFHACFSDGVCYLCTVTTLINNKKFLILSLSSSIFNRILKNYKLTLVEDPSWIFFVIILFIEKRKRVLATAQIAWSAQGHSTSYQLKLCPELLAFKVGTIAMASLTVQGRASQQHRAQTQSIVFKNQRNLAVHQALCVQELVPDFELRGIFFLPRHVNLLIEQLGTVIIESLGE